MRNQPADKLDIRQPSASATQTVLDYVRNGISRGDLEPGQRVRERELAERCEVSRSAIREALRTLVAEGTLHRETGHSATVRRYTLDEVWCYNQIREALEGLAANLAARRDEVQYHSQLYQIDEGLCACVARDDVDGYLELNDELHSLIQEMSGNKFIRKHLDAVETKQLRMQSERFWDHDGMHRTLPEHREIIAAILNGDALAAEAAMRNHIRSNRQIFLHIPSEILHASPKKPAARRKAG